MHAVVQQGKKLLQSWAPREPVSPEQALLQGAAMAPPALRKPSVSPPAEPARKRVSFKQAEEASRTPSRSPPAASTGAAKSGSLKRERAPSRGPDSAAAADEATSVERKKSTRTRSREPAAPTAPVKLEPEESKPAASSELPPLPAPTEPAAAAVSPAEASDPAPVPHAEMARMLSALKKEAKNGKAAGLTEYEALTDRHSKRRFYHDSWIVANPRLPPNFGAVRTRKSAHVDLAATEFHGWKDRDYVAEKLGFSRWREIPEMRLKLEYELSLLVSRQHPAAHLLGEGMDKNQYQYQEEKKTELQKNEREFEVKQGQDLEAHEHEELMGVIDNLEGQGSRGPLTAGGRNRAEPKPRAPSPPEKPKKKEVPQWLADFRQKGLIAFSQMKKSSEQAIFSADQLMSLCDASMHKLAKDNLAKAYLETVKSQITVFKAADKEAAEFALKASQAPTETQAADLCREYVAATAVLKAAKVAFLNSTLPMQTDLRSKLAK